MNTTDIVQTTEFTKESHTDNACCSVSKRKELKSTPIVSTNDTTKCEENIPKTKYCLNESASVKQTRINSLSHWPLETPSRESMSLAGWFGCNVTDRVICIYCNKICHEWTMNDDPAEVHRRLSPKCPFVMSMPEKEYSPKIINENFIEKFEPTHPAMSEISRREQTFVKSSWPETGPTIESLVRAGFFASKVANTVTCFYCNGSLHQWGANDNPMIEHARWFPHCTYAKHLCGNDLYNRIQMRKKRLIPEKKVDQTELNRLVSARLDLPIVERLRLKYPIAIIKRCIEDQLKIKNDDFKNDSDFTMACLILQKQIDIIKGSKDNLITPSNNQQSENSIQASKLSLGECLICLTEEKQLACMPCGHLCVCVPCGYALRTCPVCREKIQSFMRIN